MRIFVNRRDYRFTVILDAESKADHTLGDRLFEQGHCDRVVYEPLPSDWRNLFQGVAFPPPYNRRGYDRQQWSTFHMDSHSERDVLGILDSDSTFYSYLTRQNIFSEDGRIIVSAHKPSRCHYANDKVALGEDSPYECMFNDRMPIWFWRDTYAACRRHIARRWNTNFDAAFENFSRAPYSTFNILANYAIKYEPNRYKVRLMDSGDGDVVSVAQNGCSSPLDLVAGGLQTFRVAQGERLPEHIRRAHSELIADRVHLNRWAYVACGATADKERAAQHYALVWAALDQLPPEQMNSARNAFLAFVNDGLQAVKLDHQPEFGLKDKAEIRIRHLSGKLPVLGMAALRLASFVSVISRLARRRAGQ